ncbi:MAG: hypothetical protein V1681_01845 [Candidatus Neomarinimicrobiota bacterium]
MNKIRLVCLSFLLIGSLFAQEPALPVSTSPDSVAQTPALQVPGQTEPVTQMPLEPLPSESSQPETAPPALVSPKTVKMNPSEVTNYGQMIYWKSLTQSEKKVFVFAYLYRTYETLEQVKSDKYLKSDTKLFQKNIAEPVFDIYRKIDENTKDDLIFWIDKFYRNDVNKDKPFSDALRYAGEKLGTGSKSLRGNFKETSE